MDFGDQMDWGRISSEMQRTQGNRQAPDFYAKRSIGIRDRKIRFLLVWGWVSTSLRCAQPAEMPSLVAPGFDSATLRSTLDRHALALDRYALAQPPNQGG